MAHSLKNNIITGFELRSLMLKATFRLNTIANEKYNKLC